MPIYKGSTNQGLIYYGSPNTNCLTSVPKNVKLELDPLNATVVGSPTIKNGVASGFTTDNYLNLPNTFKPEGNSWEICFKVHTPSSHTGEAIFCKYTSNTYYGLRLEIDANAKIYYLVSSTSDASFLFEGNGTNTIPTDTDVLIKFQFTGTKYIGQISTDNGKTWITDKEYDSTTKMYDWDSASTIGYFAGRGLPFKGSIDLTQSYIKINNSIWWKGGTGNLTLKAGSKVYVPNGFESDGTTLKFDEFITSNDIIDNDFGNASKEVAFLLTKSASANNVSVWGGSGVVSGTSAPDFSGSSYWGVWYDTANNIIKIQNGTNEWKTEYGFSLPICLVSSSSSAVTSLDQIFDWCGFIGSTAFVLPGVKGLKSNGIKADGAYNNIEVETKSVLLSHYDYQATGQQFGLGGNGNSIWRTDAYYSQSTAPTPTTYSVWHNTTDNFNYYIDADTSTGWVKTADYDFKVVNSISTDSSFKITSLAHTTVQPLRTGRLITNVYKGSTLVYHLGFDPVTFTESGTWTVPAGIRKIAVDCVAASGSSSTSAGGKGGRVQCVLNVTSGQVLHLVVGKVGANYNASDIRTDPEDLNSRLVVAGAGGNGVGGIGVSAGAAGGGLVGASAGGVYYYAGGSGGNQTAGGSVGGTFGFGGSSSGGHGGAGWYGGGAGQSGLVNKVGTCSAGGGGGSSYTHPDLCSEVVHTQGFQNDNGYITISMV